jgi:methylthioribose-1-phosphate isomerase
MCDAIGAHGAPLIPDGARVLTHCNAGALATAGIGTALAPVYCAVRAGRRVSVYADETRPLLQGSRLTAWELQRAGSPSPCSPTAWPRRSCGVAWWTCASWARTGSRPTATSRTRSAPTRSRSRRARTGCRSTSPRRRPRSTPPPPTGDAIAIEQRDGDEVVHGPGGRTAPPGVAVYNPAFDVTPSSLVTAIVTDRGIVAAPYAFGPPGRRPRTAL